MRAAADHAVAGEDDGKARAADAGGGAPELCERRLRVLRLLREQRLLVDLELCDVLGEVDVGGAVLLGLGDLEGLADDLRDDLGPDDLGAVLRHRPEEGDEVHDLVRLLVQPVRGGLAGDGDDRGVVHVGVGDAGDEVGGARSERGEADGGAPGEAALYVGHERGALLVAGGDEAQIGVQQGVHDVEVLLARDAEHERSGLALEAANEQLCGLHRSPPAQEPRTAVQPTTFAGCLQDYEMPARLRDACRIAPGGRGRIAKGTHRARVRRQRGLLQAACDRSRRHGRRRAGSSAAAGRTPRRGSAC